MDSQNIIADLGKVDKTTFNSNEQRSQALLAARALVRRLENPWERMTDFVWAQPILRICMKTANDLKLWIHLSDKPQSTVRLAELTKSDPALLSRILRVLATGQVITETDVDNYIHSNFSAALQDPNGVVTGIDHYYDVGTSQTANLPAYLKSIDYRNPADREHLAFKYNMGLGDFRGDWWDWYSQNPKAYQNFNAWLSSLRVDQPPWTDVYPLSRLCADFDDRAPFLVDVAGGLGRDIKHAAENLSKAGISNARLILQERTEIIKSLPKTSFPRQIELQTHNFFSPQLVHNAKIYFLHSVLHDWPDVKAREILAHIRKAMRPGYSKVLLFESQMPRRASEATLTMAALDINMMAHFAALERTEEQWRSLAESVGLKYVKFYPARGANQGIIELDVDEDGEAGGKLDASVNAAEPEAVFVPTKGMRTQVRSVGPTIVAA